VVAEDNGLPRKVAVVEAGEIFGEMAVVKQGPALRVGRRRDPGADLEDPG